MKCLRPKPLWSGQCAADACAFSDICQIGGFIKFPSGNTVWFSEKFTYDDFKTLDIPVTKEMQKCIASFETLAQIAILFIFSRSSPGFRYPLRIPSLTDNSGTEAGGNKLFSTKIPYEFVPGKIDSAMYIFWDGIGSIPYCGANAIPKQMLSAVGISLQILLLGTNSTTAFL